MPSALVASPALDLTWQYFDLAAHNERQRKLRHALTRKLQSALEREAALRQENADLLKRQREQAATFEQRLSDIAHCLQGLGGEMARRSPRPIGLIVAWISTSAAASLQKPQAFADSRGDGDVAR